MTSVPALLGHGLALGLVPRTVEATVSCVVTRVAERMQHLAPRPIRQLDITSERHARMRMHVVLVVYRVGSHIDAVVRALLALKAVVLKDLMPQRFPLRTVVKDIDLVIGIELANP